MKKSALLISSLLIVGLLGGCGGSSSPSGGGSSATKTPVPTETPKTISVDMELGSGNYTSGIDFPEGKYDIEAISGGGNVSSSNVFSGGINAIMGTEEKNKEVGTEMYEQLYENIDLPEGDVLSVSGGVVVRISCDKASGDALKTRNQEITETVDLGNGNFVSGDDFPAGIYDIVAVKGGGNVSTDNMYSGGINAIMGTAAADAEMGGGFYELQYKNIDLSEGVTLTIDGVKIQLVPSK
ncbi:hypothetical protein [Papillibacter cinnamivorans]|uniref:Lipoprotein n=1 Tax=Papillibacter cinnamivorans DSM 12816 TaxID=1122930 RepID=A0A1W1YPI7_9FIRM|nr:hypothetical protein [Papillibacter cinnamivorans]SMC38053.1 hypothetical protein SAMN02745168_0590 [Papillibacter cinnamivorans DSM 12816]